MNPLLAIAIAALLQGGGKTQTQTPIPPPVDVPAVPLTLPEKYTAKVESADAVIAKVDGQVIRVKDVEGMVWDAVGSQIAEDYVNVVVARRAAVANHVTVTQDEIEKQVQSTLAATDQSSNGSPQRPRGMPVEAFLAREGYPLSRIYLNSEIEVILDKIAAKRFNPSNFVKLSMMRFQPKDETAVASTAASEKATAAAGKLKLGQKWGDVLKSSDDPPELLEKDGAIGWADITAIAVTSADLQKQLMNLKPGATTQPITISGGFDIFKVDELGTSASVADLAELKSQYLTSERKTLMSELLKAAKIQRFPVVKPNVPPPSTPPQAPPKKQG